MRSILVVAIFISIHAPREGGDVLVFCFCSCWSYFNPRPPRGGRRALILSRRPMNFYFNPRPPRGGRLLVFCFCSCWSYFNPRPPRGGRLLLCFRLLISLLFQSTPPARGATDFPARSCILIDISIHAPREGGDTHAQYIGGGYIHFNPRPPRGGRQQRCTVLPVDL